jgi:predicted nucleic acid-binding protein
MKTTRIYVDTSVIGGCCDPEFQVWSTGLLADFKAGVYALLLSELTEAEIADAPAKVRDIYEEFKDQAEETLELTPEVLELADAYVQRGILSPNFQDDARHIALATVAGADLVASWNFKHIVHFEKIQKFNAINLEKGYKTIAIYSPREVTKHDD